MNVAVSHTHLSALNDVLDNLRQHTNGVLLSADSAQSLRGFEGFAQLVQSQAEVVDGIASFYIPATQDKLKQGELTRLATALYDAVKEQYDEAELRAQIRTSDLSPFSMGRGVPPGEPDMSFAAYGRALGAVEALQPVCERIKEDANKNPEAVAERVQHLGKTSAVPIVPLKEK